MNKLIPLWVIHFEREEQLDETIIA